MSVSVMILRLIQGFDGSTAGFIILVLSQIKPFVEIFHVIFIASPRHDWKKKCSLGRQAQYKPNRILIAVAVFCLSADGLRRECNRMPNILVSNHTICSFWFLLIFLFYFNLRNLYLLGAILNPNKKRCKKNKAPRRGIEPRSPAWQAGILTTTNEENWEYIQCFRPNFIIFLYGLYMVEKCICIAPGIAVWCNDWEIHVYVGFNNAHHCGWRRVYSENPPTKYSLSWDPDFCIQCHPFA